MRKVARLTDSERRELFRNTADKMGLNDAVLELEKEINMINSKKVV